MAHGGKRIGAGRKSIAEELNTREVAMNTLVNKFGSKEQALNYLLETEEPSLIKFVYEHAFGKPIEKTSQELNIIDKSGVDKLFIEKN